MIDKLCHNTMSQDTRAHPIVARALVLRQDLFGQYLTSRVKNAKRPRTISNELPETKPQECSCTEIRKLPSYSPVFQYKYSHFSAYCMHFHY